MNDEVPPPLGSNESHRQRNFIIAGSAGAVLLILAFALLVSHRTTTAISTVTPTPTATPMFSSTLTPITTDSPLSSSTPTVSPSPTSGATPPPVVLNLPQQVAMTLFPDSGQSGQACGSQIGDYSGCPVTSDLAQALHAYVASFQHDAPEPLCRCAQLYIAPTQYTENSADLPSGYQGQSGYDAVDVRLRFSSNPPHYEHMILLFAKQSDGSWLAFNTYCDNPQNLITSSKPKVCTITSS